MAVDRKGAEIRRMAVQKTAPELVSIAFQMGVLPPVTTLDELWSATKHFIDVLDLDVVLAGDREVSGNALTTSKGGATVGTEVQTGLSLDEAMDTLEIAKSKPMEDLKEALAKIGVTIKSNLESTILGMTQEQANQLYKTQVWKAK